jgi:hypothetical protein
MRRATVFAALALVPIVLAGLPLLVWFAYTVLAPGGSSAAPMAADGLTCSVKATACVGDEVEVFRMFNTANAHAGTPIGSSYTYRVCCGGVTGLGTNCSGDYDAVLALSGTDNAHVATTTGGAYTTEVCLSLPEEGVACTYTSDCGTAYECLATVSGTTNAHVADCDDVDDYATKVCCSVGVCSPGVDTDNDGFNDDAECYLDTDSLDDCPDDPGVHDAWPLDINMDTVVTVVGDALNFRGHIGAAPGDPKWSQRLDFNMDGTITVVGDALTYRGMIGKTCT